jgi:hypothetical protein
VLLADLQGELDEQWRRLLANDPEIVFATLTEAFEDNEAPAAMAGVHDSEASIVVLVPDVEVVPERMPKLTEAGNLSLAKLWSFLATWTSKPMSAPSLTSRL